MKLLIACSMALVVLGSVVSATALELPEQKPGLWQTTMTGEKISRRLQKLQHVP